MHRPPTTWGGTDLRSLPSDRNQDNQFAELLQVSNVKLVLICSTYGVNAIGHGLEEDGCGRNLLLSGLVAVSQASHGD